MTWRIEIILTLAIASCKHTAVDFGIATHFKHDIFINICNQLSLQGHS